MFCDATPAQQFKTCRKKSHQLPKHGENTTDHGALSGTINMGQQCKVTQSVPSRTALAFDAQARRKPASVSSVTTCNGIFEIRLGSKVQFRFEVAAVTRPVRRDLWHDSAHSQV